MDNAFRDVPEPDDESIEKAIIEFYTRAEKHDKLIFDFTITDCYRAVRKI